MSKYRLAYRGQTRLEIPSDDSGTVVRDIALLAGRRAPSEKRRHAAEFVSKVGLIEAVHSPGGFYTTVTVESPPERPVPWLALRAYQQVSERVHTVDPVNYPPTPKGLLAVTTAVEGLASQVPALSEQFPDTFKGVSVYPVIEDPTRRDHAPGSSTIQVYAPGLTMPLALNRLAGAVQHLRPGSLGTNPANELSNQVGWEGDEKLADVWEGAIRQETPYQAAHFCLHEFGLSSLIPGA